MTTEHELPPLPKASKMYDIPGYDEEELKDYALADIEADRQRRGEPVAWIQRSYLNLIRESNVALHNVVVRGSILDGDGDVVPLFTAPQPAEPVKVPSDAELLTCTGVSKHGD